MNGDLISRSGVIGNLQKTLDDAPWAKGNDVYRTIENVIKVLEYATAVDAVEVVRCKDCSVLHNKWTGCPNLNGLIPPPDFFCARGERREENAAD